MSINHIAFVATLLSISPTVSFADDCDGLLVPDVTDIKKDVTTSLAYLSIVNNDNFASQKKAASVGIPLPMAEAVFKASANYDEFAEKRTKLYSEYRFNYEQKDLSQYYIRSLPAERGQKYLDCRRLSSGFQVRVEKATEDLVILEVSWVASPWAPSTVKFDIEKAVLGGVLKNKKPSHLKNGGRYALTFTRTKNKDFVFTPNVGLSTQTVFIPRFLLAPQESITVPAANFVGSKSANVAAGAGACRNGHYGKDVLLNAVNCDTTGAANAAEYEFDAQNGQYQLWVEYASNESRPVTMYINGVPVMKSALSAPTGGWGEEYQKPQFQGNVTLKDGKNTMRLERATVFPHIRRFQFVPQKSTS